MTLSNAERQRRYRQRLKARAAINTGGRLYDLLVEHLRACAKADGTVRRFKYPKRERLSPEQLANEICLDIEVTIYPLMALVDDLSPKTPNERQEQTSERLRYCAENILATVAAPNYHSGETKEKAPAC